MSTKNNDFPQGSVAGSVDSGVEPRWVFARVELWTRGRAWACFAIAVVAGVGAFLLRLQRIGQVRTMLFDEIYYVRDAHSLLHRGYETERFETGEGVSVPISEILKQPLATEGTGISHPQLGKWLIAWGMDLFGVNPLGARIAALVAGAVCAALIVLIAYRLFGSLILAGVAGALAVFDGGQFALGRVGMLDILMTVFVLGGVWALVEDTRRRKDPGVYGSLAGGRVLEGDGAASGRPGWRAVWGRPYLVVCGLLLGLGMGVKWPAVLVLAGAGIFVYVRELTGALQAQRQQDRGVWLEGENSGARGTWRAVLRSVVYGGAPEFVLMVPVAFAAYVATWFSWFTHPRAWGHTGSGDGLWGQVRDFALMHLVMLRSGQSLDTDALYKSSPLGWLWQGRPVMFTFGVQNNLSCPRCVAVVSSQGNPLIWWIGIFALVAVAALFVRGARRGEGLVGLPVWPAGLILMGYLTTYMPWIYFYLRGRGEVYQFYTVTLFPFVVFAICAALQWVALGLSRQYMDPAKRAAGLIGPKKLQEAASRKYRRILGGAGALLTVGAAAMFAYFYPIYTGQSMNYDDYQQYVWFSGWDAKLTGDTAKKVGQMLEPGYERIE